MSLSKRSNKINIIFINLQSHVNPLKMRIEDTKRNLCGGLHYIFRGIHWNNLEDEWLLSYSLALGY